MKQLSITREIAEKVICTVNKGLVKGIGVQESGKMCVEAAVCYALGLPHSDNPPCVSPAIRDAKIILNDSDWSSNQARAKGMVRLAVLQLGTNVDFDDKEFTKRLAAETIGTVVPRALRYAASVCDDLKIKQSLEEAAIRCEQERSQDAASNAAYDANAASNAANAAYAAANAAAYAANAANATSNAANAAYAARDASYAANAANAARDADEELSLFAKSVENILIDMEVPGVEWLDLI